MYCKKHFVPQSAIPCYKVLQGNTLYYKVILVQLYIMQLRHSCLKVIAPEWSSTVSGATCRMQKAMELHHSFLKVSRVTAYEMSSAMKKNWWTQSLKTAKTFMFESGTVTHGTSTTLRGAMKCNVTTTFMFASPSTWNVQHIGRGNLCDAKRNVAMTFMLYSGNTWHIQNIPQIIKLWDAKTQVTTFMFDILFDSGKTGNVQHTGRSNLCDAKQLRHSLDTGSTWNVQYTAWSNLCHAKPNVKRDIHVS